MGGGGGQTGGRDGGRDTVIQSKGRVQVLVGIASVPLLARSPDPPRGRAEPSSA